MMESRVPILFVNHSLATGGIETMIVDLVAALPVDIFAPSVAIFEAGGSLEPVLRTRGIPVYALNKRAGFDWRLALRLRKVLRAQGIRVVHSHNFSAWLYVTLAKMGLTHVRHVHTEHSGVAPSRVRYFVERVLARRTDRVVAVSTHVAEVMTRDIGIDADRVITISNGVNTKRFAPNEDARVSARREFNILPSDIVFGIVARLAEVKNHPLLLKAYAKVQVTAPARKQLIIVGDGAERTRLENLAAELGIVDCTHFAGDRRDTDVLLSGIDVYVLSSRSEGMNLTVLEALASGLPVVATAVGGNIEIVAHEHDGFLVKNDDPHEMARRLQQLADDQVLRRTMGGNARTSALTRFDASGVVEKYCNLYRGNAS